MIVDGVPEIAQSARLGHIANEAKHRLLQALQDRWDKAVADSDTTEVFAAWRQV